MVDEDNVLGFLCGSESDNQVLITIIDDEEVVLLLSKNVVTDAEPIIYSYTKYRRINNECKLVIVGLEQLYSNRFYPRVYYYIYRVYIVVNMLELNESNESKLDLKYLLQQSNGTTGYTAFYPCESYQACKKKIAELEDLEED